MPDGGLKRRMPRLDFLRRRQQRYKAVFSGSDGAWVLADIYKECGVQIPPLVPGDPYSSHFRMGVAAVAMNISKVLGETADHMLRRSQEHVRDD